MTDPKDGDPTLPSSNPDPGVDSAPEPADAAPAEPPPAEAPESAEPSESAETVETAPASEDAPGDDEATADEGAGQEGDDEDDADEDDEDDADKGVAAPAAAAASCRGRHRIAPQRVSRRHDPRPDQLRPRQPFTSATAYQSPSWLA